MSNPNFQGVSGGGSSFERSRCTTYVKQHLGMFLGCINGSFGCGNFVHKMRYFPTITTKWKDTNQAPHDALDSNSPKKNRFHVLQANKGAT